MRTKHGHAVKNNGRPSREYKSWDGMKARCYNKNHHKYDIYGKNGISVCKRWIDSFSNFYNDMGPRPLGKTLGRINGKKNYCPSNCEWQSHTEQNRNRKNVVLTMDKVKEARIRVENGETYKSIALEFGVAYTTIYNAVIGLDKWREE